MLPIKEWSEQDRPREKLMAQGKKNLSNAELLAILIRSGSNDESALDIAKKILNEHSNDLSLLSKCSIEDLMKFKGIGEAKAISIAAALELSQRQQTLMKDLHPKINSSELAFDYMRMTFYDLEHEEFWVLYLNNAHKLIQKEQISKGGLTSTLADVRVILKKALNFNATHIILCHNHPSGNLTPSQSDKHLTNKVKQAATLIEVVILDHIIVHNDIYYSFADENIICRLLNCNCFNQKMD